MSVDLNQYRKPVVEEKQSQSELWKLLNKDISFGRKKISDKFKEYFYSELGLLLESGLDIQQALDLIEQDQKSALNKKLTRSLNEQVTGGRSLSDALEESTYFDTFEVNTLRIGEETGNLAMVTKELSIHFQRKQELKRQLIGVFAYPAFVLFVSVGVVYFMLNYVVPLFSDVFKRFGADLPALTQFIIKLSEMVSKYSPYVGLLILFLFIFLRVSRKKLWYRKWTAKFITKIPIYGTMANQIYLSRFCQAMHLLTRADIPLNTAFELTKKMIRYYPLEEACEKMNENVSKGLTISGTMDSLPIFPKRMVSLVRVGEEVNQLAVIFGKLSTDLSTDVEHKSKTLGKLIEPALILIIGIFVAVILIGMYLPLFEMSSLVR